MNDERDMLYKEKMKRSGLNIKVHNFMVGDYVLLKQKKTNGQLLTNQFFTRLLMSVALLSLDEQYAGPLVTSNWLLQSCMRMWLGWREIKIGEKVCKRHQQTRLEKD